VSLPPPAVEDGSFQPERELKRDLFSRVVRGALHRDDGTRQSAVLRDWRDAPLWTRPLSAILARREVRALRHLDGHGGVPALLARGRGWLLREHLDGSPLHEAPPADPAFYGAARRLLVSVHRAGVTHDDLAKEPNWLVRPDGRPALLDFQLARVGRGRGPLFRLLAREDLRHLLKHKRKYAAEHLTARERTMLATPSCPARVLRSVMKPIYNTITRRVLRWSDREGQGPRP
jgi:RIO-like serine/threonine protein kinase